MSYDGAYPEEDDQGDYPDDYDDHGEDSLPEIEPDAYWDDDPWDGVEHDSPEPNCLGTGCYDSGTDWRGRNCRMCNPTPWQARRADWTWSAAAPWRWVRRKIRARLRPRDFANEPPF